MRHSIEDCAVVVESSRFAFDVAFYSAGNTVAPPHVLNGTGDVVSTNSNSFAFTFITRHTINRTISMNSSKDLVTCRRWLIILSVPNAFNLLNPHYFCAGSRPKCNDIGTQCKACQRRESPVHDE